MQELVAAAGIVGLGQLGGSLAWAMKERSLAGRVAGLTRREQVSQEALDRGICHEASTDPAILQDCDLVILSTPVGSMGALVRDLAPYLKPGALLTDQGSVKEQPILEMLNALPPEVSLVGGHPMAGSERTGLAAASPHLYQGAAYVLVPTARSEQSHLDLLCRLVAGLGASPLILDAALHDAAAARISHMPHLAAAAVAAAAAAGCSDPSLPAALAAGGFRDTTRVAAGDPEMWRDICLANRREILASLDSVLQELTAYRDAVAERDAESLLRLLAAGRAARLLLHPAVDTDASA